MITSAGVDVVAGPPRGTTTSRDRVLIGVVSLLGLVVGAAAALAGVAPLRIAGLWLFCTFGIGAAPWQLDRRLRLATRILLGATTSLITLVLVSTAMEATGFWHPWSLFVAVGLVATALHAIGLRRALQDRSTDQRTRSGATQARPERRLGPDRWTQLSVAGAGTALCLIAAATHRHLTPAFYGFPLQIGPLWWIGLALTVLGITIVRGDDRQLAVSVLLLAVVLTLTPAIVYDGPRSQSAAKHVDLVEQIRTSGRALSSLGIYNSWAGFFSAVAWVCDVTGIRDPMVLARYWPALLAPVRVLALRFLFSRLLPDRRTIWIAVTLALLADPLGADYFSPQSLGFVLGLAVFGLALTRSPSASRLGLLLAGGCALAVSHQLSPYVIGGVLIVLVVLRQIRPWWIPALILGPAVAWALLNFSDLSGFLDLSSIGNVANFRPPKTGVAPGLERLPVVGWTIRALAGGLLVLGLLAAVTWLTRLLRSRGRPDRRAEVLRLLALAGAPAVGLVLVAVNPYGQEGIFRAVLFAVPWLASLAAQPLARSESLRRRLPYALVSAVLTATFLIACFGLDRVNVISSNDLAVLSYLDEQTDQQQPQLVLVPLAGDLPTSAGRQGFTQVFVSGDDVDTSGSLNSRPPKEQEQRFTEELETYARENSFSQVYVLWSPTNAAYSRAYGLQTVEESEQLRDAFGNDPTWEVATQDGGTVLYRYRR